MVSRYLLDPANQELWLLILSIKPSRPIDIYEFARILRNSLVTFNKKRKIFPGIVTESKKSLTNPCPPEGLGRSKEEMKERSVLSFSLKRRAMKRKRAEEKKKTGEEEEEVEDSHHHSHTSSPSKRTIVARSTKKVEYTELGAQSLDDSVEDPNYEPDLTQVKTGRDKGRKEFKFKVSSNMDIKKIISYISRPSPIIFNSSDGFLQ